MTSENISVQNITARLQRLRQEMATLALDGVLVPRGDEFQGENVPPSAERLAWLTGFDGSAGMALVTTQQAALFVDGRYRLQVRHQIDTSQIYPRGYDDQAWADTLRQFLPDGGRIGFDPWLHSADWVMNWTRKPEFAHIEWVPLAQNLVDVIWQDRPAPPNGTAFGWDIAYAGQSIGDKVALILEQLEKAGKAGFNLLLSMPDQVAWLLNIRGHDVDFTPVFLARALLKADGGIVLFADQGRIGDDLYAQMCAAHPGHDIQIVPPAQFASFLNEPVLYDAAKTPAAVQQMMAPTAVAWASPVDRLKAVCNPVETRGMIQAHDYDACAMIEFLAWLAAASEQLDAHPITEIDIADRLLAFRQAQPHFIQPSFATIAGFGPNGAIVHYRARPETAASLSKGQLLLVDSGGQYLDGTTDITRTVAIGTPVAAMRYHYSLVLRGHIALSTVFFPPGTTGGQLDVLARQALWQSGLDYDHGTGHGVGCFLGVHDGPQRIAKNTAQIPLLPGMILSNEPGYYLPEHYGIRLENLVQVVEVPIMHEASGKPMLGFQTLTMVPFARDLIRQDLLNERELRWVNDYHRMIADRFMDRVSPVARVWLQQATAPIDCVMGL